MNGGFGKESLQQPVCADSTDRRQKNARRKKPVRNRLFVSAFFQAPETSGNRPDMGSIN
jgi:hypothetical protein